MKYKYQYPKIVLKYKSSTSTSTTDYLERDFYPRDAMLARVFARATCPSVCPSLWHTRWYCIEIKKALSFLHHLVAPRFYFSAAKFHPDILRGGVGKFSHFLALSINISKEQIGPRLLLMSNRKSHMSFRLTPRSMTLDDPEMLWGTEIIGISRFWKATMAKWIKTDP